MVSKLKITLSKVALVFSVVLLVASIFCTVSKLQAEQATCMTCDPTSGCIKTGYGFNNCTSNWQNGQLIDCHLSGGACGS